MDTIKNLSSTTNSFTRNVNLMSVTGVAEVTLPLKTANLVSSVNIIDFGTRISTAEILANVFPPINVTSAISEIVSNLMPATKFTNVLSEISKDISALYQPALGSFVNNLQLTAFTTIANAIRSYCLEIFTSFNFNSKLSKYYLCEEATQALQHGDIDRLNRFTASICRLPTQYQPFVMEALWEGRWRRANDPIAYVCKVARNKAKKRELEEKTFWHRHIGDLISLDELTTNDASFIMLTPEPCHPLILSELLIDLEMACKQSKLPQEAMQLLIARSYGYTRRDAKKCFGWSQEKVERVWRMINRYKPELIQSFS